MTQNQITEKGLELSGLVSFRAKLGLGLVLVLVLELVISFSVNTNTRPNLKLTTRFQSFLGNLILEYPV